MRQLLYALSRNCMKLSKKTDYALRALMMLVEHHGKKPVSITALAKTNDIPRRFLEQIMQDLKVAGIVQSIPGRVGGFTLARPPEEITIGEVVRRFDGVISPIHCVSSTEYEPCSQESTCRFRRYLLDIRNHALQTLDYANLAMVYHITPVAEEEVFVPLFIGGDGI